MAERRRAFRRFTSVLRNERNELLHGFIRCKPSIGCPRISRMGQSVRTSNRKTKINVHGWTNEARQSGVDWLRRQIIIYNKKRKIRTILFLSYSPYFPFLHFSPFSVLSSFIFPSPLFVPIFSFAYLCCLIYKINLFG